MYRYVASLSLVIAMASASVAAKRHMTVDDLFKLQRVSDASINPDGTHIVYTVTRIVDPEKNKSVANLWIVAANGKSPPHQLTTSEKKDRHPRWSPDGKTILFESNRSGEFQLWTIDLSGGEARQLTDVSTGAATGVWSPDGMRVAFVSAVYPEFSAKPFDQSNRLNKEKLDQISKNPVKAKVHTRLFYRHWDSYVEDKRQHLFVLDLEQKPEGVVAKGSPRDVTPGDRDAYPTSTTFSVGDDFCFSPDSNHLVFTAVPAKGEAWNTNHDLCRVSVNNTSTDWQALTGDNPAADGAPAFSPDGKFLAFRAQKKQGYEADKWELYVTSVKPDGSFDGRPYSVTGGLDRSVNSLAWLNPQNLAFVVDESAASTVYTVGRVTRALPRPLIAGLGHVSDLSAANDMLSLQLARMNHPSEVYAGKGNDSLANVSHVNDAFLGELDLPRPESVTVKGANGDPMQMWILKPPGFDPAKKWPVAFLVHGGPQGAWEDGWSFRWCPELWAAQGYIVVLPNPRGSTGFGQKYVDEITGDWGGKCFVDLMKGVDYVESLPYVDKNRIGSAGASFGGYMMNWFATQTGRFKCIITHCGVYNFDSMYATTDEIWFDEWEHGGPPWGPHRESYEKHSPHRHAAKFGEYKTPMLVIQNDLDFRCPVGQGIELFTTLQRQGVPSRFINFPDEGHWVLKPANSKYWHEEVFGWLMKYVPPGAR